MVYDGISHHGMCSFIAGQSCILRSRAAETVQGLAADVSKQALVRLVGVC